VDSTVGDNSAAGRIAAVVLSGFGRGLGWDVVMDWQGSLDQADFEGIPGGRAASVPGLAPLLEGSEPPVCIELLVIGGGKLKDVAGARCVVILEAAAAAELLEAAAVAEGWAQRQVSGAGQPARATVRDALFQDLQGRSGVPAAVAAGGGNMGLLLDVPLQLTVELGRARRTIKEVLAFGPGAVVELDRLAGEPVDVLINGKLLGKGEVVVINENFGIRVTDILSPAERVKQLG
jgi:flagellar motor switch protein FliN